MNATLIVCAACLAADVDFLSDEPRDAPVTQATFFNAETLIEAMVRGQSPSTYYDEGVLSATPPAQTFETPALSSPYDPFAPAPPDLNGGEYFDPSLTFGAVGPQPYRFGWSSRYDVGFLPDSGVSGGGASGRFGIFEFNSAWRYTTGWPASYPNWIFSVTPEFNYRSWSGPSQPSLPANVFRFGGDFELATPGNNPLSMQLGFTPAFVSDLQATPNADAFNWDARGVVFVRASPQLMIALGAAYWKRVSDILIPYAGIVWTPSDYWEFRLLFPKSRISYFLGNWGGAATWVYGGVEYNVEAYQIDLKAPNGDDEKIQIADYRALLGLRGEAGGVTGFVEVGWVFARDVKFLHGTPGFDINTGFISRLGLRF
ncbi:MAG: hypothetical protein ACT4QC_13025 [Planctomycetaceae bacterium]